MLDFVNDKARILKEVSFKKKILNIVFCLILSILVFVISWQNYSPGTWLSGWDNLHPEFNLFLNLKRSFFAVWQEYQGLGLLGGMAHAADLPRQLILSIFSLILPLSFLRYFWVFLMLFIGPLGLYFFVYKILFEGKDESVNKLSAFVASFFYLLNLATVQYFYTPYESFVSFYGFLPWLIYFSTRYLRRGKSKDLLKLLLASIIAAPAFYVQTLFVVYVLVIFVFLTEAILRTKVEGIKRSIKLLFVILISNAFWLLPSAYFTLANSSVVNISKINSFSTPETRLMNQATGDLKNISLLKGFWFEYSDLGAGGQFDYLLSPWRNHLGNINIQVGGYALFAVAVIGLLFSLTRRNYKWRLSGILLFALVYFMLASTNLPFGPVFTFFSHKLPLFAKAFRSVFTKWSIVAAFVYATGAGYFIHLLATSLKGRLKVVSYLLAAGLVFSMAWFARPVFEGNLIMEPARVEIPEEYFELFEFFKKQPKEVRIAFFPTHTFWGWNFYDWGYRGSGFLWYGIEQPILDRAFDVWSGYNEGFYNEFSTAFYGLNKDGLVDVFDKYDVSFVLVDESVIAPEQEIDFLRFENASEMFSEIGARLVFEKGKLKVYDLRSVIGNEGFVFAPDSFVLTKGKSDLVREDVIFNNFGDYLSLDESFGLADRAAVFPFSDLWREETTGVSYAKGYLDKTWVNIKKNLETGDDDQLVIPGIPAGTIYQGLSRIKLERNKLIINFEQSVRLKVGGREINLPELSNLIIDLDRSYEEVLISINRRVVRVANNSEVVEAFPLWVGSPIYVEVFDALHPKKIDLSSEFLSKDVKTCWRREGAEGFLDVIKKGSVLTIQTRDLVGCMSLKLGRLEGKKALLSVSLPYRSSKQSRPDYCLVVEGSHDCLNDEVFYNSLASEDWSRLNRQMILETQPTYWLVVSARPPDEEGEEWRIDYQAPEVESYPLVAKATFDARVWRDLIKETRIRLQRGGDLDLSLYGIKEEVDFAVSGKQEIDNCDIFERGSTDKDILESGVIYRAKDGGSACDFSPLGNISTSGTYLTRFVGENISGRGLKFYLYNKATKHNDLEVLLEEGEFDQTFSVLNWLYQEPSTYVLNVENRSFGEESKARLDKVEIYQVPLDWLSGWRLGLRSGAVLGEKIDFSNKVEIGDREKIGTSYYSFRAKAKSSPSFIGLSQGYNQGWIAYDLGNVECRMSNGKCLFPWFFGEKLEHTKVNSWANGWLVPEGEHSIVIVYWPQYLEYLGFFLVFVSFVWLIGRLIRPFSKGGAISE